MVTDDVIKTSIPFYNEVQLTDLRLNSHCIFMVVAVFNECVACHKQSYLWVVINSELCFFSNSVIFVYDVPRHLNRHILSFFRLIVTNCLSINLLSFYSIKVCRHRCIFWSPCTAEWLLHYELCPSVCQLCLQCLSISICVLRFLLFLNLIYILIIDYKPTKCTFSKLVF